MTSLKIEENVNLAKLTTMKLGGNAKYFVRLEHKDQLGDMLDFARSNSLPIFVLGGGSNTIVGDAGFAGLVIRNEIMGQRIINEDDNLVEFELGAGENWDDFVRYTVLEKNLTGAEAMVMIPGTVGALPIQNVGAYGQEVSDIFIQLEAYDLKNDQFVTLSKSDCGFGYRDSIFRREAKDRYIIASVQLQLFKKDPTPPYYAGVEKYFADRKISLEGLKAKDIMEAVIEIRRNKLPDPSEIASSGSFFKNAIISQAKADELKQEFGDSIPLFSMDNGSYKIATGWLIDKVGVKGKMINGMRPHPGNALVLTNISAKNYGDLAAARAKIKDLVADRFNIEIEQEPLEI